MCEFANKCWRCSYSRYYLEVDKYIVPPIRSVLFLKGYATINMMPKKGIFALNMPNQQCEANLCPVIVGGDKLNCVEYKREKRRLEQYSKREQYCRENVSKRTNIPREVRRLVAQEARYKCVYCGTPHGKIIDGVKTKCVVDHFIPLAQGGHPTDPSNLVLACTKCNRDKSTNIWEKGCRMFKQERGFEYGFHY